MSTNPSMRPAFDAAFTQPMTQKRLHEATGLTGATISRFIAERRSEGTCHVSGWLEASPTAIHTPWAGTDVPKTYQAKSGNERVLKYRAERRRKMGVWGTAARVRGRRPDVPSQHYLVQALFGMAA